MLPTIVHAASQFWSLAQGRKAMQAALLLCFAGLITGCGFSSTSISIVGPTPPTLTSIAVVPANGTLHVGLTRQFIATGSFSDGSQQNITASVTWSSSATNVASINNTAGSNGIATAVSAGSTTITASSGALSGSTTLNVTSTTLVSIGVTPATPTIAKGTFQQFTATGVYSDNTTQNLTNTVTWHAVNPAVASITTAIGSGGLATGVAPGTTQITATLGGVVGSTNLKVTALVSIAVTPITAAIRITGTQQYKATGTFTDLTTQTTQDITTLVTWNSGTVATATISNAAGSNGLATGAAQGTTLITAAWGAITSNANPATLTVAAFAYAVNINKSNVPNADNLSQYIIGTNGTLSPLNSPTVTTGINPYSLTTDPSHQFVYVANFNHGAAGSVSQFAIGPDGSLTPLITTPTIAAGTGPNGIAANPAAPFVYVVNYYSFDVYEYSIGAGGSLTALGIVPAAPNGNAASIALNRAGTYAYVANYTETGSVGSVSQYSVGTVAPGELLPLSPATVPTGSLPNDIVVDPSGRFVYVVNSNTNASGNSISQYTIDPTNGTLAPMTSPTVPTGTEPWSITIDALGKNAYVPNRNSGNVGTVTHYKIDATTGALTLAVAVAPATNPVTAGTGSTSIAIDPSGTFAYVTNRDPATAAPHTISQFSIAANGDLTPLTPPTAAAGAQPAAIITVR
jgi:6-phosphogluconolactonase (cycloisomerase 2 family)